jgi:hypothetical protein
MKTIARFFKVFFPAIIGVGMIFTSCRFEDDDHYYWNDTIGSLGIVEKKSSTTGDFVIHLDNGNDVVPRALPGYWSEIASNQRVLVNFDPLAHQKLTDTTVTYIANILRIQNILFKDIKKYTVVSDDSMGHDPIIVRESWISKKGGILNLDIRYFTQGSVHYINLIDNGEANGITNPFVLELRHNARGDRKDYPASAYVSFKLDYLKLAGKHETKFFIRYTDYDGRRIDLPETYRY